MESDPVHVVIQSADRPLLVYRHGGVTFKPYLEKLFTPSGKNILRDAPADHIHHHALMFAMKVDGVNFWEEQTAPGIEQGGRIETFCDPGDPPRNIGLRQELRWLSPDRSQLLLLESRQVTAHLTGASGPTLLSWVSEFSTPPGRESVELTGAHYHGLGMRFLESMDKVEGFRNAEGSEGEIVRGVERLARSNWTAFTAPAEGAPVTVAMFDHPDNPRHPAWWFTMHSPFNYLSATLNLHREPLLLQASAPLTLRYGVAVWDGEASDEAIEAARREWLERLAPSEIPKGE